ncbi:MAG: hypothetical protein ABW185_03040 [Sedimenticola sp.]
MSLPEKGSDFFIFHHLFDDRLQDDFHGKAHLTARDQHRMVGRW